MVPQDANHVERGDGLLAVVRHELGPEVLCDCGGSVVQVEKSKASADVGNRQNCERFDPS